MREVLDFFSLNDAVQLILLIGLLQFVGTQIAGDHSALRLWARGIAAAGFLSYAGLAIAEWEPVTPADFLCLSLQALLAMGTAHGLALMTLPIVGCLYLRLRSMHSERQRRALVRQTAAQRAHENAERVRTEQEHKAEELRRQQEEVANRLPPLTQEQLMAAAHERYDGTLGRLAKAGLDPTELQAARERAKQKYLRELDEVMQ